jgi:hypothetical protein
MNYQTVFEIGLRSFPWGGLLHPVPFILAGVVLFRFGRSKQIYQAIGIIVSVLATLFFIVAAVTLVPTFVKLRHTYKSGDSSVVEGVIDSFHPAPYWGAANESFYVNGIGFFYNALDMTPCFHNAPIHKGPIKLGLSVRIFYKDGCIQRVDVRHPNQNGAFLKSTPASGFGRLNSAKRTSS